jgi:uncharacterized membrane protein YeaQ/YmgE (transglycosylase-associated protein family)
MLEVAAWVISTVLVTVGAFLLVAGAVTFSPSVKLTTVFSIISAPIGAYVLIRVGRSIVRDLRDPK